MTQPLRIGILGAARIAERAVVEPAAALGHEIVAVGARDLGRAEAYAAEHGIARAYGSYDEVLADPAVEVVYNPSPNSEHVRWTLAALAAGKHVLSEKPFASNAAEARLVAARPNPSGLVVFEGFHHRYHPPYRRLLELVAELNDTTRFIASPQAAKDGTDEVLPLDLRRKINNSAEARDTTMPAVTWDHIHLRSPDPEATAAWLRDILGAEIVRGLKRQCFHRPGYDRRRRQLTAGDAVSGARSFRARGRGHRRGRGRDQGQGCRVHEGADHHPPRRAHLLPARPAGHLDRVARTRQEIRVTALSRRVCLAR